MKNNKDGTTLGNTASKTNNSSGNSNSSISLFEALDKFQDYLDTNGLGRPQIKPDAGLIRFKTPQDKGRNKSGYYSFFSDGVYAASWGDWKSGKSGTWSLKQDSKPLTAEEKRQFAQKLEREKLKREAEQKRIHAKARRLANAIWTKGKPADKDHPYLVKKHCQGLAKYLMEDAKGNLLIPIYNKKRLVSIQFVNKNGGKWFLKGSELKGSYYKFPDNNKPFDTVYLAEGVVTGWTIKTLMKAPVFCSLTAGNMKSVALQIREVFKDEKIIICCDNDVREKADMPNTGLIAANDAANAVNGLVSIPSMPDGSKCDFNDLYILAIESHQKSGGSHG